MKCARPRQSTNILLLYTHLSNETVFTVNKFAFMNAQPFLTVDPVYTLPIYYIHVVPMLGIK